MQRALLTIAASACLLAGAARADPALDQQLCAASTSGDAGQIRALLKSGAGANADCTTKAGDDHFGPLYPAVKADTIDGVAALLDAGAKVNAASSKYGLTPVFQIKSPAVGELLLRHGGDIHALNKQGETPFQYLGARTSDQFTEAQAATVGAVLLAHGADVNAPDKDMSPLMAAVIGEEPVYLTFLLDHGANINWRDSKGETALAIAVRLQSQLKPEYAAGYKQMETLLRAHGATT